MLNRHLLAIPRRLLARYVGFSAAAHLLWEFLQLPLYTIWQEAPPRDLVYAVLHCTTGDVLIATGALLAAFLLIRPEPMTPTGFRKTAAVAVAFGIAYTVGSEWFNTNVSHAWSYSRYMPTIWGIGVSPLLQWLVIPPIGYGWAMTPHPSARESR